MASDALAGPRSLASRVAGEMLFCVNCASAGDTATAASARREGRRNFGTIMASPKGLNRVDPGSERRTIGVRPMGGRFRLRRRNRIPGELITVCDRQRTSTTEEVGKGNQQSRALSVMAIAVRKVAGKQNGPRCGDRGPFGGLYVVTPKSCAYADACPRKTNRRDRHYRYANATWRNYSPGSRPCLCRIVNFCLRGMPADFRWLESCDRVNAG